METTANVQTDAMTSYLNDHQAGSMAGLELAKNLAKDQPGNEFFTTLVEQIEGDQDTLERLMQKYGTTGSSLKQAGAVAMEKVGAALGSAAEDLGFLRKLETLSMGVAGKRCLWEALSEVSEGDEKLEGFNFERLIASATSQLEGLESQRQKAARKALLG